MANGKRSGMRIVGADLTGADLTGTDLRGARLRGVDLTNVNLSGANLGKTNLYDVVFCQTTMPDGRIEVADCNRDEESAGSS